MYDQAARLVANRLYTNVFTFKGGLPAWKNAGYSLETGSALPDYDIPQISGEKFKALVGEACIVDIRTPKLYSSGLVTKKIGSKANSLSRDYLKNYFHKIPLNFLSQRYFQIPKDRTVVVMDFRGKQALVAAKFLKSKGYKGVCIIKGGLDKVKNE